MTAARILIVEDDRIVARDIEQQLLRLGYRVTGITGLGDYTPETLAPWFGMMEQRLNITDWPVPPNENNDLLRRGATKLNIPTALIRRNVNGCWNLGGDRKSVV